MQREQQRSQQQEQEQGRHVVAVSVYALLACAVPAAIFATVLLACAVTSGLNFPDLYTLGAVCTVMTVLEGAKYVALALGALALVATCVVVRNRHDAGAPVFLLSGEGDGARESGSGMRATHDLSVQSLLESLFYRIIDSAAHHHHHHQQHLQQQQQQLLLLHLGDNEENVQQSQEQQERYNGAEELASLPLSPVPLSPVALESIVGEQNRLLEGANRGFMLSAISAMVSLIVYLKEHYLPSCRSCIEVIRRAACVPVALAQCDTSIVGTAVQWVQVRVYKYWTRVLLVSLMCALGIASAVSILLTSASLFVTSKIVPRFVVSDFGATLRGSLIIWLLHVLLVAWSIIRKLIKIYGSGTIANRQLMEQRNMIGSFYDDSATGSSDDEQQDVQQVETVFDEQD